MESREPGKRVIVKYLLLAFILAVTGTAGNAQLFKRPVILETKFHAGINLPFYESVFYLMKDDIFAFDISASFPTYGRDHWEKLYNYPRTGYGFAHWSLGNNEVLGRAYSLYSFMNIPLFKRNEKFSINCQVSAGGAYLTERFDVHDNHLNRAIGSHINLFIRLGIDGRVKLSPRCEILLEAGTTHYSNGKTRMPNRGLNAGSVSLGINYLFFDNGAAIQDPEIPDIGKKYFQSVSYAAGSKVYDNLLNKRYFVSSLYYSLDRRINHTSNIGLGAALFYDGSISEALASEEGVPGKDLSLLIRIGMHGSYSIRYKHLMLGIQPGYYLYSKYTDLTRIYFRFSLQYLITENIAGSVGIKTHYGKADFIEYGIVYHW